MDQEIPLRGGQVTAGIVRVGSTVRRPLKANSPFVHQTLLFLEHHQFAEAPRFLGIDSKNREILSFMEGSVLPGTGYRLSDQQLVQVARLIRRFHDLTQQSDLKGAHEIIMHGDLGPHNTVFQGDQPVGLIDWDDAQPGSRLQDLALAAGAYIDLGHRTWPVANQARRLQLLCRAYGWPNPAELVDYYEADLERALLNHQQAGRQKAAAIFRRDLRWFAKQAMALRSHLHDV
ncbi:aminoglycoside phosphotransferase family protein [Larkinella sp. VNQ87]|uniref:aminoglycoside phosphotransferase family protein n=1 Tax=Larkinella sp. VNQ87 TaxID=3400921 RepID=UPI003C01F213